MAKLRQRLSSGSAGARPSKAAPWWAYNGSVRFWGLEDSESYVVLSSCLTMYFTLSNDIRYCPVLLVATVLQTIWRRGRRRHPHFDSAKQRVMQSLARV